MIEKRLVQWYAADAGVDLGIAEREIALTYVLRVMVDHGLSKYLAFKGGTAIRKLYLGTQGRFSLDLDFSAVGEIDPETLILNIVSIFHEHVHFGIAFTTRIVRSRSFIPTRMDGHGQVWHPGQLPITASPSHSAHLTSEGALLRLAWY